MFYGEYLHTLDKKGRIIIPSKFREVISAKGVERLFLTRGLDECLFMFTEAEWKAKENRFKSMPFTKKQVRQFTRQFFGGAIEVVPDKQWRILVPDYLRDYAGLKRNIKLIGVSDRIEVWNTEKWKEYYDTTKENYEEIAEQLIDFE